MCICTHSLSRPNVACDEHTIIQIVYSMDAAAQLLRQKIPSKLSRAGKSKQQIQKEKHVATVGANHPAVAALRKNTPSDSELTSQVISHTIPSLKSPVNGFMSHQAAALLTQMAGNDDASILTPRVILQPPPVLNVDVPGVYKDDDEDTSIDSPLVLSDGTSTGGGTLMNRQETTRAGDVVGEYAEVKYPPLLDDYSCNHSANDGVDDALNDDIDDDLEKTINDLTDAPVRKFNFLNVCPIIWMEVALVITIARQSNLQFWLRPELTFVVLTQ